MTSSPPIRDQPVRTRRVLRELLLTAGAAVGGICVLAAICSVGFGLTPLIFRSGSMAPAIGTGALGLARTIPASEVAVGDVVSVTTANGVRITHRVVDVDPGPVSTLILKGDANSAVDPSAYRVASVELVLVHVEGLGYVVSGLRQPPAIFLGGLVVGILIMVAFRPRGPSPPPDPDGVHPPSSGRPPPRSADRVAEARLRSGSAAQGGAGPPVGTRTRLAAPVGILILVGIGAIPQTSAAFVDQATATTGAFSTQARIATPTLNCGLLGVLSVQFTWPAVSGATGYDLILVTASGTNVLPQPAGATSATITGVLGNGGTATLRAKIAYPSTTWYSAPSNARSYTFLAVSLCS